MTHPPRRSEPEWYTVPEISAKLRVSRMTIYRLTHEGELRAARFRGGLRVHRADLAAYIQRSRMGA